MDAYQQAYALGEGLMGMLQAALPIIGPILLMLVLVRFFSWINRSARGGGSLEEAQEDIADAESMIRYSVRAYRSRGDGDYRRLRNEQHYAERGRRWRW